MLQDDVNSMNPEEYNKFKETLREDIATKEKAVNTITTNINISQTKYNFYKEIGTNGFNAVSQGGSAVFTGVAGQAKAGQQVSSSVSQMAGTAANTAAQGIDQANAKVGSALENAKAGSGSQVYAA